MTEWTWERAIEYMTCPLCLLARHDVFEFFCQFLNTLGTHEHARRKWAEDGGYCSCHAEEAHRLSSPTDACLVYGAMTVRALLTLDDIDESQAAETIARLVAEVDCPACEVCRQSEARHLAELCRRLKAPPFQERYRLSCGLCLPHLEHALRATPDPEQRAFLVDCQREQMRRLKADLAGYHEKRAALRRGEITKAEHGAAQTAMHKFAGIHGQALR